MKVLKEIITKGKEGVKEELSELTKAELIEVRSQLFDVRSMLMDEIIIRDEEGAAV